ncbi:MAG: ATP-dependent zinc metalloprotease FtsH [Myxococcales bacterium]
MRPKDAPPGLNPRGKKTERPSPGKLKLGSPLAWLAAAALAFLLFRSYWGEAGLRRVAYSDFLQAADQGKFRLVQLGPDWVKGFRAPAAPPPRPGFSPGPEQNLPWLATRVPQDRELVEILNEKKIRYEGVAPSGFSEAFWVWVLPIGLALLFWAWMIRRMGTGLGQGPPGVMSFGKTRARIYAESNTGVGFKDVAGIDEAVDELKEIVEFLRTPDKFRRLGGKIPKGVLLVGPPGTGKTLLARAVAGEAGVPFFSLSGSEFVEMFVGVGAARVRDLFAQAAAKAPCIIFIDELDAIGKSRNSGFVGGHDEREQTLNQLLAEMDGFDARVGLIILAATNRPEILDPALMRPGRFDRQVLVDRPDMRGREQILRIHSKQVRLGGDVDLHTIASRTPGLAGADLANIVNEAALLAARRGRDQVANADFEEAIERVVAGLEKKTRRINEREKEIVAYHESGHALVGWMLPHAQPVHKVSIIPRGVAALGYTLQLPLEDRYLMTRTELREKIAGLLGGRAAEEAVFDELSTGASDDLRQATNIARAMVREYGMSDVLGPVTLTEERRSPFLTGAGMVPEAKGYSERTAQAVDAEVRLLVSEGLERASALVRRYRDKLEQVASRLLAHEVVEREELHSILGERGLGVEDGPKAEPSPWAEGDGRRP